jgi:hypothetical protein
MPRDESQTTIGTTCSGWAGQVRATHLPPRAPSMRDCHAPNTLGIAPSARFLKKLGFKRLSQQLFEMDCSSSGIHAYLVLHLKRPEGVIIYTAGGLYG